VSSGTSYNGWPANSDPSAIGVKKFGDAQGFPFPGGVRSGDVFTVLGYVATQLHERVEPCIGGWCWGYTYKQNVNNPSQLSCHASATAIDWNAPDHPNGSSGTFTSAQRGEIYTILDEVQGAVNWLEGYDEMHFEICVNATTLAAVAADLGGPPPPTGDWFDMASKDDLAAVVWEQINRQEFLDAVTRTVWAHILNDRGDARAQLAAAYQEAQWARMGVEELQSRPA
jgi:hypothetical protein